MAGSSKIGNLADKAAQATKGSRERSTIEFPYGDLNDAVEVAHAIHQNAGTSCSPDQLAAYMGQSVSSGAFRLKIATARTFGLVETERGIVTLSPLGRRMVDVSQEREAKVAAFLAVPLYRAIFEKFKGHLLPPPAAVAREMGALGVSSKQTDKARQAFERSADQAGFFAHGNDRLVMPSRAQRAEAVAAPISASAPKPVAYGGGGGGNGNGIDPIIRGLMERLPPPDSQWPLADRARWLQTVAGAFGIVYRLAENDTGEIVITLSERNS